MATTTVHVAKSVPDAVKQLPQLASFLHKYPPSQYSALATGRAIPTSKQRVEMGMKPLSSTNMPLASSMPGVQQDMSVNSDESSDTNKTKRPQASTSPADQQTYPPNPFLPYKNPATGRWSGAKIGLRRQADLFKMARIHGVEDLLPPSIKSSSYKQQRALERGLAVRGTGEGQRVKGHKWERTMAGTLEKRRKAMEGMPDLIREWEQKGHGRGWKKYPSK